MRGQLEGGRGSTQQDYIAFWHDGQHKRATPVNVAFPPHEAPRGGILDELIVAALKTAHPEVSRIELNGAVSMYGADREISMGDGRVGSAEFNGSHWRVHL